MPYTLYYPDTPDLPLPPGHRFPAGKYRLLVERVLADGSLYPSQLNASPAAARADLVRVHAPSYVAAVFDGTLSAAAQRQIGLPWSEVLLARSLATVGGTLAAARAALRDGVSGQLAGGTHHAHAGYGRGFCVFNDCAVAIAVLRAEGAIARAAILDLDVHQGDGNATIFGTDPAVFVASVHGANNYPFETYHSDLDIGLPDGTADAPYLAACARALDAVLASRPEILFYISGVDPLISDRLGRLHVTHAGLEARDRTVITAAKAARLPLVILIGGGYADPIADTVTAYATTFRVLREIWKV
jgi:acetoin utilization deacetylase AcuC-like enzyme